MINRKLTMTLMQLITIKYFNRLTVLKLIYQSFLETFPNFDFFSSSTQCDLWGLCCITALCWTFPSPMHPGIALPCLYWHNNEMFLNVAACVSSGNHWQGLQCYPSNLPGTMCEMRFSAYVCVCVCPYSHLTRADPGGRVGCNRPITSWG